MGTKFPGKKKVVSRGNQRGAGKCYVLGVIKV